MKSSVKIKLGQIEQIKIENILNLANKLAQKLESSDIAGLASENWVGTRGFAKKTYVNQKIAALVDSSPDALDTLNELAVALGNDPNFSTTVLDQIAGKKDNFTKLPVSEGGTGKTSISKDKLLIGNAQGGFSEISKEELKAAIAETLNDVAQNGNFANIDVRFRDKVVVKGIDATEPGGSYFEIDEHTQDVGFLRKYISNRLCVEIALKRETGETTGFALNTRASGKKGILDDDFVTMKQLSDVESTIPTKPSPSVSTIHLVATSNTGLRLNDQSFLFTYDHFWVDTNTQETVFLIDFNTTNCYPSNVWNTYLPDPTAVKGKILTLVKTSIGTSGCNFQLTEFEDISGLPEVSDLDYIRLLSDGAKWLRIG